jgi:hypothetical protein
MPWEEDGTRLNIIEKGKHEWRKLYAVTLEHLEREK